MRHPEPAVGEAAAVGFALEETLVWQTGLTGGGESGGKRMGWGAKGFCSLVFCFFWFFVVVLFFLGRFCFWDLQFWAGTGVFARQPDLHGLGGVPGGELQVQEGVLLVGAQHAPHCTCKRVLTWRTRRQSPGANRAYHIRSKHPTKPR